MPEHWSCLFFLIHTRDVSFRSSPNLERSHLPRFQGMRQGRLPVLQTNGY